MGPCPSKEQGWQLEIRLFVKQAAILQAQGHDPPQVIVNTGAVNPS